MSARLGRSSNLFFGGRCAQRQFEGNGLSFEKATLRSLRQPCNPPTLLSKSDRKRLPWPFQEAH